jgi:3-hydroxybutyryl-CoA dehydrogenase
MSFEINKVGVVGAGQMGSGIAHVCALAGFDVYMMDKNAEQLESAVGHIANTMDRQIQRGLIEAGDKDAAVARIATGTGLDGFSDCHIAIEAATEDEDIKKAILKDLCGVLPADDPDLQHVVDLDHASGLAHRPAGKVHGAFTS